MNARLSLTSNLTLPQPQPIGRLRPVPFRDADAQLQCRHKRLRTKRRATWASFSWPSCSQRPRQTQTSSPAQIPSTSPFELHCQTIIQGSNRSPAVGGSPCHVTRIVSFCHSLLEGAGYEGASATHMRALIPESPRRLSRKLSTRPRLNRAASLPDPRPAVVCASAL